MDFDDFINDIELMGCHAIDESFEFEENGVVPLDAKMPTLEDEPRTALESCEDVLVLVSLPAASALGKGGI